MANGIDDLFQQDLTQPDDQGGGITKIIIEAGKTEAAMKAKEVIDSIDQTGFLSSQIDPMDLRNIGEALAAGDTEKLAGIFYNEVDQLQQSAPAAVVSALGLSSNPLGNAIAAGELANTAVQKFATDFDQLSGIDIPGDNIFSSGIEGALNLANKPIQFGADKFGTGITGISGDYNQLIQNLLSTKPVQTASNIIQYPFDMLYNLPGVTDINPFNVFKKDKTDPPVIIQQPVITPTNTGGTGGGGGADASSPDFPIIGGNQGSGQDGSQGGGGNVVVGSSFTPPSTNVSEETKRIEDILDRRSQGSSQGFNMGGLATVARYLKGR